MIRTRKAIRKGIVALLKGNTAAGDRVYSNFSIPAWEKDLPTICIYNRSEDADRFNTAPRELKRTVQFAIEIKAAGPDEHELLPPDVDTLNDILDNIADEVEKVMHADETLGGLADDSILSSTEFDYEGNGNQPIGAAILIYSVTYIRGAPDSIDNQAGISDFDGADAKWKVGHHDSEPDPNQVEAEDTIEFSD